MAHLRLTGPAEQDIASILDWGAGHFGDAGRRRYEALIETALRDVADEPGGPEAENCPRLSGRDAGSTICG
jgi:toxin ParE1/3/4